MTSALSAWNPETLAPPIGRYSHLVRVPAGHDLIYISGQVGSTPEGDLPESMYDQATNIFLNIERLLDDVAATPSDLVKLLTFAVGDDLGGFYRARDEAYARWFPDTPPCGHSLAVVARLAAPGLLLEMEGIVALKADPSAD